MPTPTDELDVDLEISEFDFTNARPSRFIPLPGEKTEICIDGAVAYQLRLIPSNKVLARFESTLEAWPAIIATVEAGRSPRTLSLDAVFANGRLGSISAGPRLAAWARHNNGEPRVYAERGGRPGRRVAEGAP
jgi:hypothetical protein